MKKLAIVIIAVLSGFAFAQLFKFQNSSRLNTLFDKAQAQIRIADTYGFYPLSVFMDKINDSGETRTHTRDLRSGLEYMLIVVGEGGGGIKDVDIEVYDSMGQMVTRDNNASNLSVVRFFVPVSQQYTFRISEAGMGSYEDGFYSLMLSARKF